MPGGGGGGGGGKSPVNSRGASGGGGGGSTRHLFRNNQNTNQNTNQNNNQVASGTSSSSSMGGSEALAFVRELHSERTLPGKISHKQRQTGNMVDCLNSGQRFVRYLTNKSLTITVANNYPQQNSLKSAVNDYAERYGNRSGRQQEQQGRPWKETRFRSQSCERGAVATTTTTTTNNNNNTTTNQHLRYSGSRARGGRSGGSNGRPLSAYYAAPHHGQSDEWLRQKNTTSQWTRSNLHENGGGDGGGGGVSLKNHANRSILHQIAKPVDDETSYNNDDLEQYRLKIDMNGFIVDKPCTMDPILTVPLSAWEPELFDRPKCNTLNDNSSQTTALPDPRVRPKKKLIDIAQEEEKKKKEEKEEEEKKEEMKA